MSPPVPRGILFDKDGVLFDFQKTWSGWAREVIEHFAESDGALAAQVAKRLGYDLSADRVMRGGYMVAHTGPETAAKVAEVLPHLTPDAVFDVMEDLAQRARPVETTPLRALFDALHGRGLVIGLATNGSEAEARAQLGPLGLVPCFDFFAGFDSGYGAKPAPGMCDGFAKEMALPPASCVMVGDSLHDLHAAKAAGFQRVGVLTGVATAEDLSAEADVILPSIADLPAWLDRAR